MTDIKKPKCRLSGQNGNVFNLIGIASLALKKAGMANEAHAMASRCMHAKSYDEALQIIMEYCEVS